MKFDSRYLPALLLAAAVELASAAPIKAVVPCDRPVYLFGGSQVLAEGVRDPGSNGLSMRIDTFFRRVCRRDVSFEVVAEDDGRLLPAADRIADRLASGRRSIALIHYPVTDIESGASVDALLQAYRRILAACSKTGSLCIIGGQQPVNAFTDEQSARQLELERRASAEFGSNYLPLHRYFESESNPRRLMRWLDSGDGRMIEDFGHELVYLIYRRRLLELTGAAP
jgi:hypothetical protein